MSVRKEAGQTQSALHHPGKASVTRGKPSWESGQLPSHSNQHYTQGSAVTELLARNLPFQVKSWRLSRTENFAHLRDSIEVHAISPAPTLLRLSSHFARQRFSCRFL